MEHVLFVIIYAATLNSHKLFGLVSFLFFLFDDKDERRVHGDDRANSSYALTYMCTYRSL